MSKRMIAWRGLVLIAILAALPACVTQPEVRQIVENSNAALEAGAILRETSPPLLDAVDDAAGVDSGRSGTAWESEVGRQRDEAVARIDAFLARQGQNAELARTVNALRIRKALLLLAGGKANLARAAFAGVDPGLAGNARDLALYRAYPALSWWWQAAGERFRPGAFAGAAASHIETLDRTIAAAPADSGIRYYLAAVRAHVYLKWASTETDPRARLRQGLAQFAGEFDDEARANVARWVDGSVAALSALPTENLRWYGHAAILAEEYAKRYQGFLDESWRTFAAEPENMDPRLRELCATGALEREPQWPADAQWLAGID